MNPQKSCTTRFPWIGPHLCHFDRDLIGRIWTEIMFKTEPQTWSFRFVLIGFVMKMGCFPIVDILFKNVSTGILSDCSDFDFPA